MTAVAAVEVTVAGRRHPGQLLALRLVSRLGQPAQCELSFAGELPPAATAGLGGWTLGAPVGVRVAGDERELFAGEVTCVELLRGGGPVALRVRAYDRLHRLRRRQQPRVLTDVTPADLAADLAKQVDATVDAAAPGPRHDRVVQHRQSDLELLVELAGAAGLHPVLRGDTLHLVTLRGYGDPVPLRLGASLWDLRVEANLSRVAGRVTAIGWHPQRAEVVRHDATPGPVTDEGAAVRIVAANSEVAATLVDQPARSEEAVAELARATREALTAHAVTLHGTTAGNADLWAGARISVRGVDDTVDGGYVVTSVTHVLDGAGYRSTFTTEPPEPPTAPAAASVTLGVVTAVDDPDSLGRVRVRLPALGDCDAGWLGVLCPGAGPAKGLVALPDVGDTVLVALPHQSPADGVVLGGLFGATAPPDAGIKGNAVRRWSMRTAAGQSIVVDDAEHSLRLENKAGSYVELTPDTLRLHAAGDLVIDAPGKAMTLRAASVDFEHAPIPNLADVAGDLTPGKG